ncbi:hypothetical protein PQX77_005383 [Marasmius sp. AFHP31]|nr:hypothetical protein PQX77_005383 [Marasmius sp. AFHP31]
MFTICAYAPSIISQLTTQRDDALADYNLLLQQFADRIFFLRNQLAALGAEPLSLQNENEPNRTMRSSRSPINNANANSQRQMLSSDDATRSFPYNAAKNRTIQSDVRKSRETVNSYENAKPEAKIIEVLRQPMPAARVSNSGKKTLAYMLKHTNFDR